MDKFSSIPVGSDRLFIRVSGVAKIIATSTTVTTITYVGGATAALTHAAATGNAQVEAIEAIIAKAVVLPWNVPVYVAKSNELDKAVSDIN